MKPPRCQLCKRNFSNSAPDKKDRGGLVRFADYKPLPKGMVGHPYGLVWFCPEHILAAKKFSKLNYSEAMEQLRKDIALS